MFTLQLRGHGASGRPGEYSFELMRDDVLGLLDALGLERVTLIGHSMGGVVSCPFAGEHLAGEHPERVDRLVLGEPHWDRLPCITATRLFIGDGSESPVPQDDHADMADRVPKGRMRPLRRDASSTRTVRPLAVFLS